MVSSLDDGNYRKILILETAEEVWWASGVKIFMDLILDKANLHPPKWIKETVSN